MFQIFRPFDAQIVPKLLSILKNSFHHYIGFSLDLDDVLRNESPRLKGSYFLKMRGCEVVLNFLLILVKSLGSLLS